MPKSKASRKRSARGQIDAASAQKRARHRGGKSAAGNWLYGHHAVTAALDNPARVVLRVAATDQAATKLKGHLGDVPLTLSERGDIERIVGEGAVHQGVAAEVEPLPERHLGDILATTDGLARVTLLALDQASDPRNVGAVLRSAAAFGAVALIQQDRHAPPASAVMAKAASGGLERVALVSVTNLARALAELKAAGFWIVGLDGAAPEALGETRLPEKCCLVLGAEGGGLRRLTREACDLAVRIPINQSAESLNLSNAAAVVLYEMSRQGSGGN